MFYILHVSKDICRRQTIKIFSVELLVSNYFESVKLVVTKLILTIRYRRNIVL